MNDYQKELQFRKLNAKKEDRRVKVLRDGNVCQISIFHILVGDILLLEPGDVTSADGILVSEMNLKMDESAATGNIHTHSLTLTHSYSLLLLPSHPLYLTHSPTLTSSF